MRVTAVGAGSRGDVEPLVHLGREMVKRGHVFKLVCLPRFKDYVEENGLEFAPLEFDGEYMMRAMLTECPDGIAYMKGMKEVYHRNPEMMDQVYHACIGADLIVYVLLGGFAHHAAEALNIPCVRCFYYPFDKTNQYNIMLADVKEGSFINGLVYTCSELTMNLVTKDLLNEWRVHHGLKKWGLFSDYRKMNGKYKLTLYPYSELLVPREPKWKNYIHVTGYWMDEGNEEYTPDEKLHNEMLNWHDFLSRDDYNKMPFINAEGYHSKTVAYSIWHIIRIEDIVVNSLIRQSKEVLFDNAWRLTTIFA